MELTVKGSGAFAPARRGTVRNPSGYAVRLGSRILLFDVGFGNLRQLARARLNPADVTDVFLSHRHPDHVGDLAALLFLLRYDVKPRAGRLRLWGPAGINKHLKDLFRAHHPWLGPKGYTLKTYELHGAGTGRGEDFRIDYMTVRHPTPALAYKLVYKGKSLVYSGDTGQTPGLAAFAAGCDLFLIEATVPQRQAMDGHLTPRQALAILKDSGCKRGLLTHLSEESLPEARRRVAGARRFGLARDLQRVRIV